MDRRVAISNQIKALGGLSRVKELTAEELKRLYFLYGKYRLELNNISNPTEFNQQVYGNSNAKSMVEKTFSERFGIAISVSNEEQKVFTEEMI